jgi:hypothetical protein
MMLCIARPPGTPRESGACGAVKKSFISDERYSTPVCALPYYKKLKNFTIFPV